MFEVAILLGQYAESVIHAGNGSKLPLQLESLYSPSKRAISRHKKLEVVYGYTTESTNNGQVEQCLMEENVAFVGGALLESGVSMRIKGVQSGKLHVMPMDSSFHDALIQVYMTHVSL